ncbi:MAG TPA: hypothetical protein VN948_01115 [Terriglobales bacterium]|nr:hypothetical protein [Terriglobales bacterium]
MAALIANEKRASVRGLGEIALGVNNLDAMQKFYEEVVRLPLMARDTTCAFFKIAEGYRATAGLHCGRHSSARWDWRC